MADKREQSVLLVELDAILDTRLALLSQMNSTILTQVLKSNQYHDRISDHFDTLPIDSFYQQYNNRDTLLLQQAIITPIIDLIKNFIYETVKNSISTPNQYEPKVIVNYYPYKLSTDEVSTIVQSIVAITDGKATIEAISASYEEIHPSYVKKHLSLMVMYEYYKWLDIHSNTEITCPEVGLIGPRIYYKDYDKQANHELAFKALEQLTRPIIALQLVPVRHFSVIFRKA